jgi:hypothetical protein
MPWRQEVYVLDFTQVSWIQSKKQKILCMLILTELICLIKTWEKIICALYFNLQLRIKSKNLSSQGASVDCWILAHKTDINLTTQSVRPAFIVRVGYNNTMT